MELKELNLLQLITLQKETLAKIKEINDEARRQETNQKKFLDKVTKAINNISKR